MLKEDVKLLSLALYCIIK